LRTPSWRCRCGRGRRTSRRRPPEPYLLSDDPGRRPGTRGEDRPARGRAGPDQGLQRVMPAGPAGAYR
jgi:hypothetical protein